MTRIIVTFRIMPEGVETDLKILEKKALLRIKKYAQTDQTKVEVVPIAFGLKSINVSFIMDEAKGSTEDLEKEIVTWEEVASCETVDVRRIIG